MSRLSRERLVRSGLALALLAGVLAVTIGTGYRSSEALLDSASAWLPRDGELVRVNAVTGDVDAQAAAAVELATGTQPFEPVQISPGVVYVVNNETGEAWRMPTDTLQPQPVLPDQDGDPAGDRQVAGDAGQAYLLDDGKLSVLEAPDQGPTGPVPLPADVQLDQLRVDSTGTAWALSGQRDELYEIQGVTVHATHPIPQPGQPALLTLAADQPVVYQPTAGVAAMFDKDGDGVRRVDGLVPADERDVHVSSADERVLVVAVQSAGELFKVDFGAEQASPRTQLRGRAGARFGPLVVAHGFVYLPDHRNRHVVVVDLGSLQEVRDVPVPGTADIDLVARDGWVWANDPYGALFSFDRDGQPRELDDGGDEPAEPEPDQNQPEQPQPDPEEPQPEQPGPPEREEAEQEEPVQVPDVTGEDRVAACDRIEEAGLRCEPAAEVRADCPGGQVVSSDPAAGSAVPPGTVVAVRFCTPPRTIVPAQGATVDETCLAVQAAALVCQRVIAGYAANTAEFHRVVSYQPAAGTEVDAGSTVAVGYLEQPPTVAVPSVVGMDPTQACQTLQATFLGCSPVADFQTPTVNVVQQQNVPAGTAIASGTAVQYFYEDIGPAVLHRWKQDAPLEGNYLTVGAEVPGGYNPQPDMGRVYPVEAATAVPGLMVVNGFTDQRGGWLYSASTTPPAGNTAQGPRFACFNTGLPQPAGTVALLALANQDWVWKFAPDGSGEEDHLRTHGYGGPDHEFVVCYMWPR